MAENVGSAWYDLDARDDKLRAKLGEVDRTLQQTGQRAEQGFFRRINAGFQNATRQGTIFGSVLGGMGIGAGIGAFSLLQGAVRGVTDAIGDAVKAAQEEEAGIARMNAALDANVPAWEGSTSAIEARIAEGENLAFSDDAIRDSMARLVTRTHDVNEALDLQRLAMDLARARGMDLVAASDLIGKVQGGNIGVLARYGIAVEAGSSATEALAAIQRSAAGQAEAFADTSAGAGQRASIAWENLQEEVGTYLLPVMTGLANVMTEHVIPALRGVIDPVVELIGEAADLVSFFVDASEAADDFGESALDVIPILGDVQAANQELAGDVDKVVAAQEALRGWADSAEDSVGPMVALIQLSDQTGESMESLRDRIADAAANGATSFAEAMRMIRADLGITSTAYSEHWDYMALRATEGAQAASDGAESKFREGIERVDPVVGQLTALLPDKLRDAQGEAVNIAGMTPGALADALLAAQFEAEDAFTELARVSEAALDPVVEAAALRGFLASEELAAGLADNRPAVVAEAEQLRLEALARLEELEGPAGGAGRAGGGSFASGVRSMGERAKQDARNVAAKAGAEFGIDLSASGWNVGDSWVKSLVNRIYNAQGEINSAVGTATLGMKGSSPPPIGPLRDIDEQAINVARAWLDPFSEVITSGAGQVSRALSSIDLSVVAPRVEGASAYLGGSSAMAGGSTTTQHFTFAPVIQLDAVATLDPAIGQRLSRALIPEFIREVRRQRISL